MGDAVGISGESAGYLVSIPVTFLKPNSIVSSAELVLCLRTTTVLTEVVVAATAKMATAAMIIWAAIDIPALAVAAVAIIPAPVAMDVPADEAACTAID
jgi:hypothetical protein